jgi:hypothetical protein
MIFDVVPGPNVVIDVGDNITAIVLALIAGIPAIIAAFYAYKASKSTDSVSSIAQSLNGGFEARVRNANRDTAAESGTTADAMRALQDAETSRKLSAEPQVAPVPPVTGNPKITIDNP